MLCVLGNAVPDCAALVQASIRASLVPIQISAQPHDFVIPAKAEIQGALPRNGRLWIPAFVGMALFIALYCIEDTASGLLHVAPPSVLRCLAYWVTQSPDCAALVQATSSALRALRANTSGFEITCIRRTLT